MISEIELIKILNNKQKTNPKMMMDNYRTFIYTLLFSKISNMYPREYIEKYVNDIFHEILNYKDKINSQNRFIKVLLASIAKRKIMDEMYRINISGIQMPIDDMSIKLDTIGDSVMHQISLKDCSSQLLNDMKSLSEHNSEIIIRNYYLNQSSKDFHKNTGLKVSTYA